MGNIFQKSMLNYLMFVGQLEVGRNFILIETFILVDSSMLVQWGMVVNSRILLSFSTSRLVIDLSYQLNYFPLLLCFRRTKNLNNSLFPRRNLTRLIDIWSASKVDCNKHLSNNQIGTYSWQMMVSLPWSWILISTIISRSQVLQEQSMEIWFEIYVSL